MQQAEPPGPQQPPALDVGGWASLDAHSALSCYLTPFATQVVPRAFRTDWARAHVEVFELIRDARAAGGRFSP